MTLDLENDPDIKAIRQWMAKETYLPQDLEDRTIKKFLHSCYNSLEKTKKCIEKFCNLRATMPEIYTTRDPCSDKMITSFSMGYVTTYQADKDEVLCHYLEPNLDKFDYYDILKSFAIQADFWIKEHDFFADGHIIVLDIKHYTFKLVTKVNVFHFQKFLLFLLEAMPVRLKQVHVINCPSFYEKLYALVKTVLPQDVCDIISFHPTYEGLHSEIDKKYLPSEYGGEGPSLKEQHKDWVKTIQDERKLFLDDSLWKADLKKKPKTNGIEETMNGSFRSLAID